MTTDYSFVKSQMGTDLLVCGGYTFGKEKQVEGKSFWKCTFYNSRKKKDDIAPIKCKGRAVMTDSTVTLTGHHFHSPDFTDELSRNANNEVVRLAKETRDAPRNIVMAVAGSVSVLHASGIRKTGNLKKLVQRQRKGKVAMPKTLEELILTNGDCVTSGGEDMLLYDSGPGRNRTVIFATISNLEFLALNTTWVVDGTFKVCPGIFSASGQLYTIQAAKHRTTFPAVYMLMTGGARA
ncbi:hypothetical protein DMENIID0001_141740 [Sergentomyia squamirostris]